MDNPYLSGNFAPVTEERTEDHELEIEGVIPPDLEGHLLRNGPNPALVPTDQSQYHWFSGDGMIHAIGLEGGRAVSYRNRWVRTRKLAAELNTTPPKGPSEPVDGPANTHVIRHAGRTLALVESGFPHALSPDLERARIHDFDGSLSSPMTAHPKVDPDTGELVFFGYDVFGPPFLRSHVVDAKGVLVQTEEIDVPRAVMIHDFGVTATRMVFLDLPVLFDMDLAVTGQSLPFRWMPEAGARVGILGRGGRGSDIQWIGIDPCYVFHVLNAFDDGQSVVMDVVRYDSAFDTLPGESIAASRPVLARWTLDPAARRVHETLLDDTSVEFPRIDDTVAGRQHRFGYCTQLSDSQLSGTQMSGLEHPAGLVKYDLARDEAVRFQPGEHGQAGEPVFVRGAEGHGEDEGWVLSVVYDPTRDASDLVVLDATAFAGPPVATVHLPARVPFGFHGSWIPATA